ncbi:glycosyltransferase family 2 protein [uncultured Pedobacter sp.]|uniref:glycosyltransferase family 2 protein n=1 Tax=uncultured Pedobacter sp. TaxID=246139 RepID=UPI0025F52E3B|nr:glycosyltransferase family 2 protein [uncultured Pedobacter sp.]
MSELISVIMPAYNAARTIEEAVLSVISQTYKEWELIIVIDGGTDASLDIANKHAATDQRIIIVDLDKNGGLPNARNKGFEASKGKWITFLDSDDVWNETKLQKQYEFHLAHKEFEISHTGFSFFYDDVQKHFKADFISKHLYHYSGDLIPQLLYKNNIGVLTVMMARQVFVEAGQFNTNLKTFEDVDLWIRVGLKGYRFGYIKSSLAFYRINANGISRNISKYKKAYNVFIKLYAELAKEKNVNNKVWENYYRYFGTEFYKMGLFKLSYLYFSKSMSLASFNIKTLTTLVYMLLASARNLTSK